jgi:hypothetical protein
MSANPREVQLSVTAQDRASSSLRGVADALRQLQSTQGQVAASAKATAAAFGEMEAAIAANDADGVRKSFATINAEVEKASRAFASQEAGLEASRAEYTALQAQLVSARNAIASLSAAAEAEGANQAELAARVRAAEAAYRALAQQAERAQLGISKQEGALAATRAELQRVASAANAADSAIARVGADGGKRGFLGLRAHEATNLSFQINDLITQVASGTSPLQAFAQQGGQIVQIFPRLGGAALRAVPGLAALSAVLAPVGAALKNVGDEADSARQFSAQLARMGDGYGATAKQLADTAQQLDRLGPSLADARAEIALFVAAGIDPSRLEAFGRAAGDLATVTGKKVPEAAAQMAEAFTGGFQAVAKLDDSLRVLSAAEREEIRTLFESGRAADARTRAFEIFAQRMDRAAEMSRGPWSHAFRNLGGAWNFWIDGLANDGPLREAIGLLGKLGRAAADATSRLAGATDAATLEALRQERAQAVQANAQLRQRSPGLSAAQQDRIGPPTRTVAALDRKIAELEARMRQAAAAGAEAESARSRSVGAGMRATLEAELTALKATTAARKVALAGKRAYDEAINAGATDAVAAEVRAKAEAVERYRLAQAASRETTEAAKREAEAAADRLEELRQGNEERRFQLRLLKESAREAAILEALRSAEDPRRARADAPGASLAPKQAAEVRATAGSLFDQQAALKASEAIDAARLELAEKMGVALDRQVTIAARAKQAGIDLATAEGRSFEAVVGKIFDLEAAQKRAEDGGRRVNELLARRNELMAQADFADAGRANSLKVQVEGLNDQLREAITAAAEFWRSLGGPEAEAALGRLAGLEQQLQAFGHQIVLTRDQAASLLADAGSSAFADFVTSLAEGQNAIKSLGNAFAATAAGVLQQLAQMILRAQVLKLALKSGLAGKLSLGVNSAAGVAPLLTGAAALQRAGGAVTAGGVSVMAGAAQLQVAAAALAAANAMGSASIFHTGGVVGGSAPSRSIQPAWFAGAMRYHSGGIAGLRPGEIPAILERGEEVLTRDDPRHVLNGAGANAASVPGDRITINNMVDSGEMVDLGVTTRRGEKALMNFIRSNKSSIQAALE